AAADAGADATAAGARGRAGGECGVGGAGHQGLRRAAAADAARAAAQPGRHRGQAGRGPAHRHDCAVCQVGGAAPAHRLPQRRVHGGAAGGGAGSGAGRPHGARRVVLQLQRAQRPRSRHARPRHAAAAAAARVPGHDAADGRRQPGDQVGHQLADHCAARAAGAVRARAVRGRHHEHHVEPDPPAGAQRVDAGVRAAGLAADGADPPVRRHVPAAPGGRGEADDGLVRVLAAAQQVHWAPGVAGHGGLRGAGERRHPPVVAADGHARGARGAAGGEVPRRLRARVGDHPACRRRGDAAAVWPRGGGRGDRAPAQCAVAAPGAAGGLCAARAGR
ncbi:hypothetical protein GGI06_006646, partial [Coemansia sp. S85]